MNPMLRIVVDAEIHDLNWFVACSLRRQSNSATRILPNLRDPRRPDFFQPAPNRVSRVSAGSGFRRCSRLPAFGIKSYAGPVLLLGESSQDGTAAPAFHLKAPRRAILHSLVKYRSRRRFRGRLPFLTLESR